MRIGILGRHEPLLAQAIALVRMSGHEPVGTLSDAVLAGHITSGQVDAVVIGGGVEHDARGMATTLCAANGMIVLQPKGLEDLVAQLGHLPG